MQVKTVSIDNIKPYENNPRNNDDAVDAVANSIKEFGWQQPIVVDNGGVIVVGHTRYLAAKKLGLTEVPIVYAKHSDGSWLTNDENKAYRIADNKTNDFSIWDNKKLLEELSDIPDELFTGFEDSEIFDDVLNESDASILDDIDDGITYTINFKTQNKTLYQRIKDFINEEQSSDEATQDTDSGDQRKENCKRNLRSEKAGQYRGKISPLQNWKEVCPYTGDKPLFCNQI